MRMYVIGGPGSGKTSLAVALGERLSVPVVHLDDHWSELFERPRPSGWTWSPASASLRDVLVADWLARDAWIVEGAEPPFLGAFAQAADLIIWCDVPFSVAASRIVSRHILADLKGDNAYSGYRRLYGFLRSVRRRYAEPPKAPLEEWAPWTRAQVAEGVARYPAKVIRVRGGASRSVLDAVLERVPTA